MAEDLPECNEGVMHDWRTVGAEAKGYDSLTSYAIEECRNCDAIRFNPDRNIYIPDRRRTTDANYQRPEDQE